MTRNEAVAPVNGSNTVILALVGGAVAGLIVAFRMVPKRNRMLAQAHDTYDDLADSGRKKKKSLISSVLCFAARNMRRAETATGTVQKVREKVSGVIHSGAKEAHTAIDSGAKSGHHVVDTAAGALCNALGA